MIIRKKGETNKQWAERCQAYVEQLEENNRVLRVQINQMDILNPRTGKTYREEAETMFEALALVDHFFRNKNTETAEMVCSGAVHLLGFNELQIVTDELIVPGAYRGE